MSKGKVLVTGASGYIAGYVVKALIADGWSVSGTIRSLAKADAVRASLGLTADQLPLTAADLTSDAGWAEATAGCDFVQHIASPLPTGAVKTDDDLIVPARDGALRLLRAAKAAGVKRVVMTSSVAAMYYGMTGQDRTYTEADWSDLTSPATGAYAKSKTIAERAARDWIAAEGGGMEYCTINPALVLGPVLGNDFSGSLLVITKMLNGELPGLPAISFGICDVRDIATAHLSAMTTPGIDGGRFLCSGEYLSMADVAAILKSRLADKAKRVPTMKLPNFLVRVSALFDAQVKLVLPELGRTRVGDASHARAVIGWNPRPVAETIVDTARSLIAAGLVKS
ncbi:NAD-dependent epimerase/dehydratase family protein [Polymorphobacter sp. PAMC 29334]|uniref:NAD-dependent epimerase/dehydratase family protein n=1 Tax=Polymorphobacter sp. PAMC 29334 TaxID=2862331 RepID=UPI001C7903B6|nr:NAD-dependent epimerase/dehydratase family protein [Polymorphobacter sp. PAMC 29334]QYE35795.1 NAD-dependent epimerase/dehydratase family protein [Polymorphobacter sp. PAMC 29334]